MVRCIFLRGLYSRYRALVVSHESCCAFAICPVVSVYNWLVRVLLWSRRVLRVSWWSSCCILILGWFLLTIPYLLSWRVWRSIWSSVSSFAVHIRVLTARCFSIALVVIVVVGLWYSLYRMVRAFWWCSIHEFEGWLVMVGMCAVVVNELCFLSARLQDEGLLMQKTER